jgi:hypothetical protein
LIVVVLQCNHAQKLLFNYIAVRYFTYCLRPIFAASEGSMTSSHNSRLPNFFQHKPNRKQPLSFAFLCCLMITGCGGGESATPAAMTPVTPPAASQSSAQQFVSQQAVALQSLT